MQVNGNIFSYTHPSLDRTTTNNEKTLVIPLTETYWKKADKTPMNRSEFLNLLTGVKAIYIEAPYHLTSGQANLSWIRMSDAKKSEGNFTSDGIIIEALKIVFNFLSNYFINLLINLFIDFYLSNVLIIRFIAQKFFCIDQLKLN